MPPLRPPRPKGRFADRARGFGSRAAGATPVSSENQGRSLAASAHRSAARRPAAAPAAQRLDRDRPRRPRLQRPPAGWVAGAGHSSGGRGQGRRIRPRRGAGSPGSRGRRGSEPERRDLRRRAGVAPGRHHGADPDPLPDTARTGARGDAPLPFGHGRRPDPARSDACGARRPDRRRRARRSRPGGASRSRDRAGARRPALDRRAGGGRRHRSLATCPPRRPVVAPPGGRGRRIGPPIRRRAWALHRACSRKSA